MQHQRTHPPLSHLFDIREFGARGDGKTDETDAINAAVRACAEAGGGQVLFPPGRYLSGTIHLQSHMTLRFEAGATLVGTPDLERYQQFTPPAGTPEAGFKPRWHRALLLGVEVEEVALIGPGVIDGNRVHDPQGEERMRGPHTLLFGLSRGITLRELTLRDAANYAVMLEGCDEVELRGLHVTGGWDGVHFRGWPDRPCRQVTIQNCRLHTGDDAIAGRYWEDVLITDCVLNAACNGIRLIGPATRLTVHRCLMYGPGRREHRSSGRTNMLAGVNLQPGAWDRTEGLLEDVLISDCTMKAVATPLHLSLKPGNRIGKVVVSRLSATGVYGPALSVESWAAEPIEHVLLRDVSVEYAGGGTEKQAALPVKSPGVDPRPLPAWGLFARNVRRLELENVRLSVEKRDRRPALLVDRVAHLGLDGVRLPEAPLSGEPIRRTGSGRLVVRDALPAPEPERRR